MCDASIMADSHDYLHSLYRALHDSPMQRKFRELRPMPFGVVFLPWAGMREEEMREHFRLMKRLGFHNLKQTMPTPEWPTERILEVALEEGVIPFWYGEGGWERITPELLGKLGLPSDMKAKEAREHPKMIAYQSEVVGRRIHYPEIRLPGVEGTSLQAAGYEQPVGNLQLGADPELRADAIPLFKAWCRRRYGSIEKLRAAWNQGEVGISDEPYESWEAFEADAGFSRHSDKEYGRIRDILRFKADVFMERIRARAMAAHERDPEEPQRAGGEMGLFLPFAWRGTDMEGIAETMKDLGSFYPSIHLAWHFEEIGYEQPIAVYMQASLCVDWFKGGWAATWESTGGPQQLTGAKGWHRRADDETPGFSVTGGTMTQLLLSYLAAGFKGAGLWAWNYRMAGWEAGEFALLNRQLRPGERAIKAGRIARAANRLRDEIWELRKEPYVGVYVDWNNEAMWAAVSWRGRGHFRSMPVQARIGASRTLIDGNIPWEHVTTDDLRAGLAGRYRTILLPCQLALREDVVELLGVYVEGGGRVALDAPGGWYDENGKVLNTAQGSAFEQLFGVEIADFQYTRNLPRRLGEFEPEGFVLDLMLTRAEALERFDTGEAAVTRHRLGKGEAVVLAWEACYLCRRPGNVLAEELLRRYLLGPYESPYACEQAVVYRLAGEAADHYFFINDGPACEARLDTRGTCYNRMEDAVTGEAVGLGSPIGLDAYSGRWLRCVK